MLAGAFAGEDDTHGGDENSEIGEERDAVDVDEVVAEFLFGTGVVAAVDLGEAGEAGAQAVAALVEGIFRGEFVVEYLAFGTGTDEAHVSAEDVPQLGELIGACFS